MAFSLRPLRNLGRGLGVIALAALASASPALSDPAAEGAAAHTLVMVEQPGCFYCIRWHEEIAPAYPKTDIGAFAPLRSEQLRAISDDLSFDRRVMFTPTFVLVDADGVEIARLEGYPGEDFFWPMIEQILIAEAGFEPAPVPAPTSATPASTTPEN